MNEWPVHCNHHMSVIGIRFLLITTNVIQLCSIFDFTSNQDRGGHKRLSPQFGGGNTPRRGKNRTMSNEEALYEHSSLHRHIHHFIRHGNNSVPVLSVPCRGGFVFQPLCNHLANQLMVWPFWPFRASGRSALLLWSQAVHRSRTCLLKPFCTSKVC